MSEQAEPVPPLLVAEGWDLTFFRSQASLGGYIEPWFPSDVDYRAFDRQGRRLELIIIPETEPARGFRRLTSPGGHVIARLADDQADAAEELHAYLRDWLNQINAPGAPANATLSDLLSHAIAHGDLI